MCVLKWKSPAVFSLNIFAFIKIKCAHIPNIWQSWLLVKSNNNWEHGIRFNLIFRLYLSGGIYYFCKGMNIISHFNYIFSEIIIYL